MVIQEKWFARAKLSLQRTEQMICTVLQQRTRDSRSTVDFANYCNDPMTRSWIPPIISEVIVTSQITAFSLRMHTGWPERRWAESNNNAWLDRLSFLVQVLQIGYQPLPRSLPPPLLCPSLNEWQAGPHQSSDSMQHRLGYQPWFFPAITITSKQFRSALWAGIGPSRALQTA